MTRGDDNWSCKTSKAAVQLLLPTNHCLLYCN